jgi:hypothetical protein
MNANDLTFGVEIETVAPESAVHNHGLRIGSYRHGIRVPYLPAGWTAERDGSIQTGSRGHACEIVSPILRGAEGLAQVAEVIRTLEQMGHTVNRSCGVHCHVGWRPDFSAQALARLIVIASYLEKGLYAITGTKARERGTYCGGVKKYGNPKDAKTQIDKNRYHLLNLTNLAKGTKPTVEFRCFSGSVSATKVVGWIQVCLGLVEKALTAKRAPTWNPAPPTGGLKKDGEGQSECERLMHYLCWADGSAKLAGGRSFGWIFDGIPRTEVKTEFRRLAKKYDTVEPFEP